MSAVAAGLIQVGSVLWLLLHAVGFAGKPTSQQAVVVVHLIILSVQVVIMPCSFWG
jgi:hypothetical protein